MVHAPKYAICTTPTLVSQCRHYPLHSSSRAAQSAFVQTPRRRRSPHTQKDSLPTRTQTTAYRIVSQHRARQRRRKPLVENPVRRLRANRRLAAVRTNCTHKRFAAVEALPPPNSHHLPALRLEPPPSTTHPPLRSGWCVVPRSYAPNTSVRSVCAARTHIPERCSQIAYTHVGRWGSVGTLKGVVAFFLKAITPPRMHASPIPPRSALFCVNGILAPRASGGGGGGGGGGETRVHTPRL
jgi:hypothetical protein